MYNTTLESKRIEESLPLSKGAGNLCLVELQPQSRLVHTNYKLTYNLRDSIISLLIIYSLLRIFRLVLMDLRNLPLLVPSLNPSSPKVLNQPNDGKQIYIKGHYKSKDYFSCIIYLYVPILTQTGELK